jgi:hypothetical protein
LYSKRAIIRFKHRKQEEVEEVEEIEQEQDLQDDGEVGIELKEHEKEMNFFFKAITE